MTRPALLRRLPRPVWRRGEPQPLVAAHERERYPELEPDFALLDELLLPAFHARDADALEAQNAFWRQQLGLILGGTAATVLGIVQASFGGGVAALGVVEAILASLLTWVALSTRAGDWHRRYLTGRLQAERLRSEYFVFLARAGAYAGVDDDARRRTLRTTIAELDAAQEDV